MSEYCMIDRVARALLAARERRGHGDIDFVDDAYAAIVAMREPTEAMLAAGDSMMPQIAAGEDITTGRDALADAWPAMIDQALADGTVSGIASD